MAKATGGVTRVAVECNDVTLTLTIFEAQALMDVMANVGGPDEESLRYYTDNIYRALGEVGLSSSGGIHIDPTANSLYFKREDLQEFERDYLASRAKG